MWQQGNFSRRGYLFKNICVRRRHCEKDKCNEQRDRNRESLFGQWRIIRRRNEQSVARTLCDPEVEDEQNKGSQMYEDDHIGDDGHGDENKGINVEVWVIEDD